VARTRGRWPRQGEQHGQDETGHRSSCRTTAPVATESSGRV